MTSRISALFLLGSSIGIGLVLTASTALATGSTAVGSVPGQTRAESQIGDAIATLCPNLPSFGAMPGGQNDIDDLFDRCSEFVFSVPFASFPISSARGTSNFADEEEYNDALDNLTNRQIPAIGDGGSDIAAIHTAIVTERLYALRGGAQGIQIAGTLTDSDGNSVPVSYRWFDEDSAAGEGDSGSGIGAYLNFVGGFGDRKNNSEELGFDFRNLGGVAGADYRITDTFVMGAAFGYTNIDADFDGSRGGVDTDTYAGSLYASFHPGDFYLDNVFTAAHSEIDTKRNINYFFLGAAAPVNRTARGDTDANEFSYAGAAGYQFHVAGLNLGPVVRGEYLWLDIDSFTESGAQGLNLSHGHDSVTSATLGLGGEISYPISTGFGIIVPQLSLEWEHQFADDSRRISASFDADPANTKFGVITKSPDRDYMNLSASVAATFKGGFSAFLDYSTLLLHSRVDAHVFTLGGRFEF